MCERDSERDSEGGRQNLSKSISHFENKSRMKNINLMELTIEFAEQKSCSLFKISRYAK